MIRSRRWLRNPTFLSMCLCMVCFGGLLLAQGPFKIESGAPANTLVVDSDSSGRVGIGTDSPAENLDIASSFPQLQFTDTSDGSTWEIEADAIEFAVNDGEDEPFRIEKGAPPTSIHIEDNGDVGFGTSDPEEDLHIRGGSPAIVFEDTSGSPFKWRMRVTGYGVDFIDDTNGGVVFGINPRIPELGSAAGDVGIGTEGPSADLDIARSGTYSRINAGSSTFTTSSSRTLKENIRPCDASGLLSRVATVPVYTYDWKQDRFDGEEEDRRDHLGLIAEDFHTILGRGSDKEINGQEVQMVLWMAVQELHAENTELRARLDRIETLLAARAGQ